MTIIKYFGNLSTLAKRGLQTALLGSITAMLVSCGGGGVDNGSPLVNGSLAILPNSGSLYANVPVQFDVAGGKPPYLIVSNEQTVLPLNFTLNGNTFVAAPSQPGVFDPQSDPNEVPSRSLILTVRDAAGTQITATYKVLQNFLTGYGLSISTTASCTSAASSAASGPAACAGADSLITLQPASNGLYYARKQFRFTANYGAFSFITDSTGTTGPTVISTADDTGTLSARIRVTPNAPTQYAQFRMTDIVSGNYRDFTFVILNSTAGNAPLSVLPSSIALTGADSSKCGTGFVNMFVFGGTPPYRASTTFPNSISITPPIINQSGDAFIVSVFNPNVCLSPGNIVVTDATGANVTATVTTSPGTTPPVLPLTVTPGGTCLQDGGSITVLVSGGNATKLLSSSNPSMAAPSSATMSGSGTFTVNPGLPYAGLPGPPSPAGTIVTITVNDGTTSMPFNILRKTTCP